MIKKITLIGRARVGKSRICAEFCKSKDLVLKYFTGSGSDCTQINIEFVLNNEFKDSDKETILFTSPESSLNHMFYDFNDEGIKNFLDNIEKNNKYSVKNDNNSDDMKLVKENCKKYLDPTKDSIKIIAKPSEWALKFMHDNNIKQLILNDTPGVSGNVKGLQNINNAHIYLFVMRPDNRDEFTESVNKMIPSIAGASVIYIYNMGCAMDNASKHKIITDQARIAMKDFVSRLEALRGDMSIIDTSIEVLNPSDTVIPMGAFEVDQEENFAESMFKHDLAERLTNKLNNSELIYMEDIIRRALTDVNQNQEALIEYIKEIVNKYKIDYSLSNTKNYIKTFLSEGHDRVKSNDKEITLNAVEKNRTKLLLDLYTRYKSITVNNDIINDVSKSIQETVIQYCYKKITLAVKNDCGMSQGNHIWESQPPITMWAQESVIAEELIKHKATSNNKIYTHIMAQNGYTSKSWNFVSVDEEPYEENNCCNKKLEIISKCKLNSLPSIDSEDVIFNAYNLALLKIGHYEIFQFVINCIKSNDSIVDWI